MTTATAADVVTVTLPRDQADALLKVAALLDRAVSDQVVLSPAPQTALPLTSQRKPYDAVDRATAASIRDHIVTALDRAGVVGLTTADVVDLMKSSNLVTHASHGRATYALTVLEKDGRIFRHGIGLITWYAARHREPFVASLMAKLPEHDLTTVEAADVLGLGPGSVRTLIDAQQLTSRRVGNATVVHRASLAAYINKIGTTEAL
ncbi:helix-turn-helix domain-containing protein [Planomonospora sp. ID82291]|uniref:helix-turn-helix domain-containing protein n=1 Tax=Planomonospora sp. ID82291 TaxID=2738136 RepID=UPI0018C443C4|nr:helix-turn-helix domain-containing protein [Planomonospora sp. ID82291]MBG0818273.1 helix-turn-helix domain-containing protein [Planomonospora sp. ID82291]